MKHAIDAAVSRRSRRCRFVLAVVVASALVPLSACATPTGSTAPPPTSATSATGSPSPTPSVMPSSPTTSVDPSPTATEVTDEPFNGQILIITSEVRDGRLEVTAMVPQVAESGGTCTLTVPSTGARVTTEASEGKDVTYCGVMAVEVAGPTDDLAFVVSYTSATTRAESALTTVEPAA